MESGKSIEESKEVEGILESSDIDPQSIMDDSSSLIKAL